MEKSCFNCKYFDQPSFEMKEFCWECLRQEEVYTRWERKPITNADRIRSMTDEELVEFLAPYNSGCPKEHGSVMACHDKGCYKCWEDWLKEEVSE